jgi:hypothetical protein
MLPPLGLHRSTYFHRVLAQEEKVGDNGRLPTIFGANLPGKIAVESTGTLKTATADAMNG